MDDQEFPTQVEPEVLVQAVPRLRDVPRPARGFRSGPMAAVVATVVIVAATALPGRARFMPIPASPSPVVSSVGAEVMPDLETVGTLSLGGSLTEFTLVTGPDALVWGEREDGSAALSVRLESDREPSAYLEGVLTFRGHGALEALDGSSRELYSASVSESPGFPPVLRATKGETDIDVYGSLAGTLVGGGALEGAFIEVRNVPGTAVRRGAWGSTLKGRAIAYEDTIFARVVWLRGVDDVDVELDDAGEGSLGLSLPAPGR